MDRPIAQKPILEEKDAEAIRQENDSNSHNSEKAVFLKKCKEIFESTQNN